MKVEFHLARGETEAVLRQFVEHRFQPPPEQEWKWTFEIENPFDPDATDPIPPIYIGVELVHLRPEGESLTPPPHMSFGERNANIVRLHDKQGMSFKALGELYGISGTRVSQVYRQHKIEGASQ